MHKNRNLTVNKDAINSHINYGRPCLRLSLRSLYQWKKQPLPLDALTGTNSTYTFEKFCNFWHRGAKLSRDEKISFSTGCRYLARVTSYARRKSFTVNFRKKCTVQWRVVESLGSFPSRVSTLKHENEAAGGPWPRWWSRVNENISGSCRADEFKGSWGSVHLIAGHPSSPDRRCVETPREFGPCPRVHCATAARTHAPRIIMAF